MTAGAPLTTTIVAIDAPAIVALALAFGVIAGALSIAALRARRRRVATSRRVRAPQVAMPYAAAGGAR